ncbi:hypothetical protein [Aquimarina algiphila]|uniref:Uncharacterized protein n=1 Tax=Aquimarina algiphila TaxID=2047982 RepID=A0A554VBR1_9FLAO|nr:hypothetical protein [Aquimarina algiphila]TSE04006.1 hypothetical protein FOF46_27855 [Aquimarina algiphila]
MKKLIYLLTIITLLVSCEKKSADELTNDQGLTSIEIKESDAKSSSGRYSISGATVVTPGTVVSFSLTLLSLTRGIISLNPDNPDLWKKKSRIGGSRKVSIEIKPSFTCGEITFTTGNGCTDTFYVTTAGSICDCDVTPTKGYPPCICNPQPLTTPSLIIFDNFLGSNPVNGDFCINTTANVLRVNDVDCVSDYIWSISPTVFGTDLEKSPISPNTALLKVSQPGEYVVSVKAVQDGEVSPARFISLTAENCFGGGF